MKLNSRPNPPDSASNTRARAFLREARVVMLLCAIYFVVDFTLNRFFSDGWTIIWPLNGVNIAILLLSPRREEWPWILLGIEAGTFLGQMLENTSVWMEIYQRGLSVIEVVLCAWVLPPFSTIEKWFQSHRIFPRFVTALLVGPGVSGVLAALLFHYAQGQEFWRAFNIGLPATRWGNSCDTASLPDGEFAGDACALRRTRNGTYDRDTSPRIRRGCAHLFSQSVSHDSLLPLSAAAARRCTVGFCGLRGRRLRNLPDCPVLHCSFPGSVRPLAAGFPVIARPGAAVVFRLSHDSVVSRVHPVHGAQASYVGVVYDEFASCRPRLARRPDGNRQPPFF